ncbi:bifunctional tetrahydrofolate synthase/dihydrofolate synthase [Thiomicrorhabdus sp.]|uniref:bifunctional tetrahydrofolate synthase/dihydrofolate synthase n=1 Tax=Thiomicrorhabdus sp. TaxID=2039724 RepID=UPI0035625519
MSVTASKTGMATKSLPAPDSESTLQEWIDWLLGMHAQEIDLGLERVALVAQHLGVAKPAPFVISVAGTNGKGSSVAMLSTILDAQGYRVGTYTSPHILRFNERIQLNGQMVDDRQIIEAFVQIEAGRGETKLTYFEFSTLAALLIFKNSAVDVAVLEVGLGGRLDAVNLVDADAALITAIDVDHVDWLGDDRSVIATEKAGIMRPHCPAVCSDPNPPQSLFDYAEMHRVPLTGLGRDFNVSQTELGWSMSGLSALDCGDLPIPALKGQFQIQNAAGVVALLSRIQSDLPVGCDAISKGLHQVKHPGRLQTFKVGSQDWLLDVAHNPQSSQALADYLGLLPDSPRFTALFSVLNDKDSLPMVKLLSPWVKRWVIADLAIPRSTTLPKLHQLLLDAGIAESAIQQVDAMSEAVELACGQSQDSILVWGSFFTVSQVLETLVATKRMEG